MKVIGPTDVLLVLGHAAEFHGTDEGVREAAKRILPEIKNARLKVVVEGYINSPAPLSKIKAAIEAM